jgi:hypothetical protein
VIKDNDLVIATHGRSFWILDDIAPLRQLTPEVQSQESHLFAPATAMRIRANTNHDTPLPAEVPAGENPPPGAIFYYYLNSSSHAEVKLEVLDAKGQVVRSYSSKDLPFRPSAPPAFPMYWFHPPEPLSTAAGMHRFVWDLRYAPPPIAQPGYSMSTAAGTDTPREPEGPQALPGNYQVRLTADGRSQTQPFKLVLDPRVKTSPQDLEKQFALELRLVRAVEEATAAVEEIHSAAQSGKLSADDEKKLAGSRRQRGPAAAEGPAPSGLATLAGTMAQLITVLDTADAAPTTQASQAAEKALAQVQALLQQWNAIKKK